MASNTTSKMITLRSTDGKEFVVSETVALQSRIIRILIEEAGAEKTIQVPNVNSKILAKVIEYCNAADASSTETTGEGSSSKMPDNKLEKWEQDILDVDQDTLLGLTWAAFYLDISMLRDATRNKGDVKMKGKSPEE